MGLISNLQNQQVAEQKAAAYDQMQQQAREAQIHRIGQEQGLADMANHVARQQQQQFQQQSLSPEQQVQLMVQRGELTPQEGQNTLLENRQFNEGYRGY